MSLLLERPTANVDRPDDYYSSSASDEYDDGASSSSDDGSDGGGPGAVTAEPPAPYAPAPDTSAPYAPEPAASAEPAPYAPEPAPYARSQGGWSDGDSSYTDTDTDDSPSRPPSPYGRSSPQDLAPMALGQQLVAPPTAEPSTRDASREPQASPELVALRATIDEMFASPVPASAALEAGPDAFYQMVVRKGEEWQAHTSDTSVHKLEYALGARSSPDPGRAQLLRDNVHHLFWILWSGSARMLLRCSFARDISEGLAGHSFDPGHLDMCHHLEAAASLEQSRDPARNQADAVLLAEHVAPSDVNDALGACWRYLHDGRPGGDDSEASMFGSASVEVMQAIVGLILELLVNHIRVTEQQGANVDALACELDRTFANYLALSAKRAVLLMAAACVSCIAEHAADAPAR